jgi:hypothetical protein
VTVEAERDRPPRSRLRDPWYLTYGLGLVVLLFNLIVAHATRAYNSDDVAVQTMLGQWLRGYHHIAHMGADSFILKIPLYALVRAVMDNGRAALFVTTLVLNVAGFALFAVSVRYFAAKLGVERPQLVMWPLLWVVGLGMALTGALITPNLRNVEIGLAFLLVMLVAKYWDGELRVSPIWLAVAVPFVALFIYNDPYFLYLCVLPLVGLLVVSLAVGSYNPRAVELTGFLLASVLVYEAVDLIFRQFGLHPDTANTRLATLSEIRRHLGLLLHGGLRLFEADVIDNPVSPTRPRQALNLAVILCTLLFPLALYRGRVGFRDQPWKWFFGLYPLLVAAAFVFSTQAVDLYSARYLVLLPFLFVLLLAVGFQAITNRTLRTGLVLLVAVATLVNLGYTYDLFRLRPPGIHSDHRAAIRAVRDNGFTKGYATYWNANINTYLSKERVDFIQVTCVSSKSTPYAWLTDDGILAKPATRTFYLWDALDPPAGCLYDEVVQQFGAPARVVPVSATTRLLVYDYDLLERM